jgi:methyl-accepting chemotaxis protein
LAQATTYASLNATIEASSSDRGMHMVSSLASEVGKLSLLSKEASEHINELVRSIQEQLSQSKQASDRERAEAADSLTVINRALESLNRMSKDAMQIAQSVQAIDHQVVKQSASTKQIALRMTDLHTQAKSTMREATRIQAVSVEQKKGIKANSTAVTKLSGIVQRLGQLIGARK